MFGLQSSPRKVSPRALPPGGFRPGYSADTVKWDGGWGAAAPLPPAATSKPSRWALRPSEPISMLRGPWAQWGPGCLPIAQCLPVTQRFSVTRGLPVTQGGSFTRHHTGMPLERVSSCARCISVRVREQEPSLGSVRVRPNGAQADHKGCGPIGPKGPRGLGPLGPS